MSSPDSWRVHYEDALVRWVRDSEPDAWTIEQVEDWISRRRLYGPPDDARRVFDDDDLFSAVIPRVMVVATYWALGHERLILIQDFDSPTVAV